MAECSVEITSPANGAQLSSPLGIVSVRYRDAGSRAATIQVGDVVHVAELAGRDGLLRENVTFLEGSNRVKVTIGHATARSTVTVAESRHVIIDAPTSGSRVETRATEINGRFTHVSCPAGVIAVNGFMQQFAVTGSSGDFAEKIVLRPGANHLAVQIGELYATRHVRGAFNPAKLLVTLVWDTDGTDVDLYVLEPGDTAVWFGNKQAKGTLDVDRTQGYGPENYSMGKAGARAPAGTYRVRVHYFSDRGLGRTEWTARVITDESAPGQQRRTFFGILDESDSGRSQPGERGPDWNEVCRVRLAEDGAVRFEG
jgi:uncharacterized protein YfaP (DUF2135 family)